MTIHTWNALNGGYITSYVFVKGLQFDSYTSSTPNYYNIHAAHANGKVYLMYDPNRNHFATSSSNYRKPMVLKFETGK